jgi:NAD dependent epimerase/dehydratase family enzyme
MSWISLADEVGAIRFLLDHEISGPVDLTAPEPVTNAQLTKVMGAALHRPSFLAAPAPALRLALGRERADALLFVSQRVLPAVLREGGYEFRHPLLVGAVEAALDRGGSDVS